MKRKKVVLLFAAIGMMLMSSCSKEETPQPEISQHPIMGKWYLNLRASTDWYKYTDEYIQYCQEHQTLPEYWFGLGDENSVSGVCMSSYLHYFYWDIYSSSMAEYYIQYKDGKISTGTLSYKVTDSVLYWGKNELNIQTLDNDSMAVQYVDTLYYINDNGEEQIAGIKTRDFVFGRTHIPPTPTGDEPGDDLWSDPNPG